MPVVLWKISVLITACNPLEPRTIAQTGSCTQCIWWVELWTPFACALWQELAAFPKGGRQQDQLACWVPQFTKSLIKLKLRKYINSHFFYLRFGVAKSPGGIPFVNSSRSLPIFLHLIISLASGILTRMDLSTEVSCCVAPVGFSLRVHQDEIGSRRPGNKIEEESP